MRRTITGRRRFSAGWIPVLLAAFFTIFWIIDYLASSSGAVWPEFVGEDLQMDGNLMLDCTHSADGYVLASVLSPSENRMKLRMTFGSGAQLTYDLDNTGQYETFPLQLGSGTYEFSLYENAGGTKYSSEGKVTISVQLNREDAAFLAPNQYVNYTKESPSVLKADELSEGHSETEIYQAVCDFMGSEFSYDFIRAQTISPGELPEVDPCYESRMGICQDLAAVMVSMLRTQGIASRLMIGYADSYYHAWTVSYVNGEEKFFDPTAAIGAMNAGSYTVERFY